MKIDRRGFLGLFVPALAAAAVPAAVAEAKEEEESVIEGVKCRVDGEERWMLFSVEPPAVRYWDLDKSWAIDFESPTQDQIDACFVSYPPDRRNR